MTFLNWNMSLHVIYEGRRETKGGNFSIYFPAEDYTKG